MFSSRGSDSLSQRILPLCRRRATSWFLALALGVGGLVSDGRVTTDSRAAAASDSAVPTNLVVEGIPPIPAALKSNLSRYLTLGGSSFRGWHSTKREMMVTLRVSDATQLHSLKTPGGTRKALTRGTEAAASGSYRPLTADCLI